ncbi:MAG: polyprenyl synthetase family protein [Actinobacteria bacterium]|nr:polyprenyl synthetase family protein [Actinomycetota bacterium]MTB27646.1 polyprenyl synthetase family protein [Actinomycetota bacterium]
MDSDAFRAGIQLVVDRVNSQEAGNLAAISPDLAPLMDSLVALMSGGKRLRPAFCYWGWRSVAAEADLAAHHAAVLEAAAGLEFLQACALIHDDVMDGSDTRRGLPAAHRVFEGIHAEAKWVGQAPMFGIGAAILLGDLCLSWADQVFLAAPLPTEALQRAKPIFDVMRTELMAGQYLDLLEQARSNTSLERAHTVVRYKSAKYTIERPLHLGAALAGASNAAMQAFTDYGLALGEAFQLRDDVLGVFGDPAQTGKPAGDDIREGKRTVMVSLAYANASLSEKATMTGLLGKHDLDANDVATAREILTSTGALAQTEILIEQGITSAYDALRDAPISEEGRSALADLIEASTRRAT